MSENNLKILLVDDEIDILEFLSYNLRKRRLQCLHGTKRKRSLENCRETSTPTLSFWM